MDPAHQVTQRIVHQAVLLDEPQPRKRGAPNPHLEMVSLARGVLDLDRRPGEGVLQPRPQILDGHHASPVSGGRTSLKATARHLAVQAMVGVARLSKVHFWFAFGCSTVRRNPEALPVHSENWIPGDGV